VTPVAGALAARTLARPSFESAFAAPAFGRAMLAFESALAQAQAEEGLVPEAAARAIAAACASIRLDEEKLVAEGKRSATLAVPLVEMLRAEISKSAPDAAKHAHLGATSQDVLDTAMALCLKACLDEADRSLDGAVRGLAAKAREHAKTPMMGRTLMQAALPITAGLKIGHWALALAHDRDRLAEAAAAGLAVQLGGPVGALEALGAKGPAVRHRVAMRLGLADAPVWHVHRNAWIDLLDRTGQVVITAGKIALDVSLLQQPEVGEMLEAPPRAGVGASSSMPHKRNPVGCVHALAAATRMPGLLATIHAAALAEHERALGGWQAELAVVPDIASQLGSCLDFLDGIASSLVVDAARMKANLAAQPAGGTPPSHACDEVLAALSTYL
jgi:3-carboxy-cis,cis-muconate cycloisomerase